MAIILITQLLVLIINVGLCRSSSTIKSNTITPFQDHTKFYTLHDMDNQNEKLIYNKRVKWNLLWNCEHVLRSNLAKAGTKEQVEVKSKNDEKPRVRNYSFQKFRCPKLGSLENNELMVYCKHFVDLQRALGNYTLVGYNTLHKHPDSNDLHNAHLQKDVLRCIRRVCRHLKCIKYSNSRKKRHDTGHRSVNHRTLMNSGERLNTHLIREENSNAEMQNTEIHEQKKIDSLEEVYKILNIVLRGATMNDTDGNDFPNMTIDAEAQCIDTLNLYYTSSKYPMEDDDKVYCNSSWNGASCWPRTPANTTVFIPCPAYLIGINASNNASKVCDENGLWAEKADYHMCVVAELQNKPAQEDNVATRIIYNVGFTVSTVALIVALFIFLYFRGLRCLRNSIHCHLIVSFIIKYILWIIMHQTYIHLQHASYSWLCKMLTTIFNFANATNFFWMFVEGLYLHIIIVWTYSADKIKLRYLLLIGWGLPTLNIIPWIIVRAELENTVCWLPQTDEMSEHDYILYGPIFFVLFANIIFLSTIVWVLITKLRASHSLETRQYRKAVKATVILFPLLGITYVLFIMPPSDHHKVQTVFEYINAVLQSFQGLLVAVFYCFLNGEVKSILKKKISRFNDARSLSTKFTRASYGWTRASEYGHSTISQGNGTCILTVDNKIQSFSNSEHNSDEQPERIPLANHTNDDLQDTD